ncbi:pseudouridine synthase [Lasiosphaeria hispida]|uniref:Pseudouridine synthase n=1 Tax=Lasiosphaeria hispida TaxID=260671 RepID=A0AAJ0H986_9PEZI|nr:pseudouridine synthase [Lasiosphaeria hispida]
MADYVRWTKDSLIERVKQLEDELKQQQSAAAHAAADAAAAVSASSAAAAHAHALLGKRTKQEKADSKLRAKDRKKKPLDPAKYSTRLVALKLAYLGKNYNGFEYQPCGTLPTIEEELWKALVRSCLVFPNKPEEVNFMPYEYAKCGRTDRGVSAFGQVISLRLRSNRPVPSDELAGGQENGNVDAVGAAGGDKPTTNHAAVSKKEKSGAKPAKAAWDPITDEIQYCKVLNRLLPPDIRILAWCPDPPANFSARFSCRERQYRYFFTQPAFPPAPSNFEGKPRTAGAMKDGWLDIDAMRKAAKMFEGLHDFRNFCKIDPTKQITNFMRRVFESDIVEVDDANTVMPYFNHHQIKPSNGDYPDAMYPKVYYFHVRGSAFLWHQIRHMVAILFLIGQGLEKPALVADLLDATAQPRKPNFLMADEVPLVLWDCIFPKLDAAATAAPTAAEGLALDEDVHDPETEANTELEDGVDWVWLAEASPKNDLVNQLWEFWREKKIDELLASKLLNCVAVNADPDRPPAHRAAAKKQKGANSQRIFEGGDSGRMMGIYMPVLKRPSQASVEEINDKWAQSKGYANGEELTRNKFWRTAIREAKEAADEAKEAAIEAKKAALQANKTAINKSSEPRVVVNTSGE